MAPRVYDAAQSEYISWLLDFIDDQRSGVNHDLAKELLDRGIGLILVRISTGISRFPVGKGFQFGRPFA